MNFLKLKLGLSGRLGNITRLVSSFTRLDDKNYSYLVINTHPSFTSHSLVPLGDPTITSLGQVSHTTEPSVTITTSTIRSQTKTCVKFFFRLSLRTHNRQFYDNQRSLSLNCFWLFMTTLSIHSVPSISKLRKTPCDLRKTS